MMRRTPYADGQGQLCFRELFNKGCVRDTTQWNPIDCDDFRPHMKSWQIVENSLCSFELLGGAFSGNKITTIESFLGYKGATARWVLEKAKIEACDFCKRYLLLINRYGNYVPVLWHSPKKVFRCAVVRDSKLFKRFTRTHIPYHVDCDRVIDRKGRYCRFEWSCTAVVRTIRTCAADEPKIFFLFPK
jgi:hypothetical protein